MTTAAGYIGNSVEHVSVTSVGRAPLFWFGTTVPDGDASPWRSAPVGSLYVSKPSESALPVLFFKVDNNENDNDWGSISIGRQFAGQSAGLLLALTHA